MLINHPISIQVQLNNAQPSCKIGINYPHVMTSWKIINLTPHVKETTYSKHIEGTEYANMVSLPFAPHTAELVKSTSQS